MLTHISHAATLTLLAITLAIPNVTSQAPALAQIPPAYGVDMSFPIHHGPLPSQNYLPNSPQRHPSSPTSTPASFPVDSTTLTSRMLSRLNPFSQSKPPTTTNTEEDTSNLPPYDSHSPPQTLPNRAPLYTEFIDGCVERYPATQRRKSPCLTTESDRIKMNLAQPSSMQNYTRVGFVKTKTPPALYAKILDFYNLNKGQEKAEAWPTGNTYTNHWTSPTYMISLDDRKLRGGDGMAGPGLKQEIWKEVGVVLSDWLRVESKAIAEEAGEEEEEEDPGILTPTSLYGIRVYKTDSVLAPHVDRLPLVTSAIINVAQTFPDGSLVSDWPLEVYDHAGVAHNVSMKPGDMVLYESHTVLHGRPFRFEGLDYANVFVHFEPRGHTTRHGAMTGKKKNGKPLTAEEETKRASDEYRRNARDLKGGGHEHFNHSDDDEDDEDAANIPVYILKGTNKYNDMRAAARTARLAAAEAAFGTGTTVLHTAAARGDLSSFEKLELAKNPNFNTLLSEKDANDWAPIHEASRGGHLNVVEYLVDKGVDYNGRTNKGGGKSPLGVAREELGEGHEVVKFFRKLGALDFGPEL